MTPSENIEYFSKIINSTPEGKDFSRWFDFSPARTGRFYIKLKRTSDNNGIYIPSKSYFSPSVSGSQWYYEFTSSHGAYGHKRGDLKDLFREFMIDAVRKSRPSTIKQSKIEEYFSDPSNSPKGKFEIPEEIYSKILKDQGLITDFSFIRDLPIMKNLSELGIVKKDYYRGDISVSFYDIPYSILGGEKMRDLLLKCQIHITDTKDSTYNRGKTPNVISFSPGSSIGKKSSLLRRTLRVSIGAKDKEKVENVVESSLDKCFSDLEFYLVFNRGDGNFSVKLDFIKEYAIDVFLGKKREDIRVIRNKFENELVDLISKSLEGGNIFKIELLSSYPEVKEKVLKKIGIPDPSKLEKFARLNNIGWFKKS